MTTLYAHQQRIVDLKPNRALLCWDTGTGKSLAGIELALQKTPNILVVCPKALREKWMRDMEARLNPAASSWRVMTKEEFRRDWDKIGKYDALIFDEMHHFAGMKSAMSKSAIGYIKKHHIVHIFGLTATPFTSSPWSVYRLAQIMGVKWDYWKFFNRFFAQVRMGTRMVPVVRSNIKDDLADMVKTIADVVSMEECIDVPPQVFETEHFVPTKPQLAAIKKIKVTETNPVVKFTKTHQILNGALKGDEYNPDQLFDCDKIDRILDLAEENKKIAVFCRYNLQIDQLSTELKKAGKTVFMIRGDVKDRDEVVLAAESASECVVLINSSCSEGYELPSIGVIVFASLSFSYVHYKQALGRFLRINHPKKNVYIHLVVKESIDEDVYDCIMNKQTFDLAIYSKQHAAD